MRGVPNLAERLATLTQRAQEASPHYSLLPSTAVGGAPAIDLSSSSRPM
ncbi:hypothetical protein [Streptomyces sp. BE303]|nr:hypothetical protein [Streptomyces sp. BE303]MED7951988.1 hypothetical protein [Streptomyces sp. BE303]